MTLTTITTTLKDCFLCEETLPPGHFALDGNGGLSSVCRRCAAHGDIEYSEHPCQHAAARIFNNLADRMGGATWENLLRLAERRVNWNYAIPGTTERVRNTLRESLDLLIELRLVVESNGHFHTVTNPALLKLPRR